MPYTTKLRKNASLTSVANAAVRDANRAWRDLTQRWADQRKAKAAGNWRAAQNTFADTRAFQSWLKTAETAWHLARLAKVPGPDEYEVE